VVLEYGHPLWDSIIESNPCQKFKMSFRISWTNTLATTFDVNVMVFVNVEVKSRKAMFSVQNVVLKRQPIISELINQKQNQESLLQDHQNTYNQYENHE